MLFSTHMGEAAQPEGTLSAPGMRSRLACLCSPLTIVSLEMNSRCSTRCPPNTSAGRSHFPHFPPFVFTAPTFPPSTPPSDYPHRLHAIHPTFTLSPSYLPLSAQRRPPSSRGF
ncbi:hypothetical protein B0H12DRAFT_1116985 [Mycena haematopus]|nr:hypothetical protein B0H12DRAFT_1116985 [Mycena haematopus]